MYKGSCHCQSVQYTVDGDFLICSHCHCESCRKIHGAAFVTWTAVLKDQIHIHQGQEHLLHYESSPQIVWMSCMKCGSSLFQTTRHSPEKIYISLSSFDEEISIRPDSHVSIEEKVSWIEINDSLPKFKQKSSDRD